MTTIFRNLKLPWLLVVFLLLPALTRAETAVQAWVQRYNGLSSGNRRPQAVAVDGSNNVIVTGYSMNSGGYSYYATIKYSSAGVALWTNLYDPPGNYNDEATAVAVDSTNNVIVTGYSTVSGGTYDYTTIKYSSAGVALWTNRYNGLANQNDLARAVAVDGSNNVIVTGYSTGGGGTHDYATIKYSGAGAPLWTNRFSGPFSYDDEATAVAVDGSGNVIVTGYSTGSGLNYDYATISYSSAGAPLWTNRYNGPANQDDLARAVAVDGSGDVIVAGGATGGGGTYDYATIKYSSAGVPLWTNRYNGPVTYDDEATAVAVDGSGNVIVTGYSTGSELNIDYTTLKYSSTGAPLWTNRYSGLGHEDDFATAVAVDGSGNAFVTGYSSGSGSYYDYATLGYSSAGVLLWTNRYNGPGRGNDEACAVVVDHSGNVIVTGYSLGSGTANDYATIKYLTHIPPPVMTGLQLTNGTFQVRVDDVLQPGTLVIEAASNLSGWSPVFTNTTPTNVLFYTDPDADNLPTRFYRAFQFP